MDVDKNSLAQNYKSRHTDELLEMHASGTLTDVAYEVLEEEIKLRNEIVPDRPEPPEYYGSPESIKEFFTTYWKGEKSLTSAFWGLYIGGRVLIFITVLLTIYLLNKYIFIYLEGNIYEIINSIAFYGLIMILVVPHSIIAWVSVIRCAKNAYRPIFGTIATIIIFFDFLSLINVFFEWVEDFNL